MRGDGVKWRRGKWLAHNRCSRFMPRRRAYSQVTPSRTDEILLTGRQLRVQLHRQDAWRIPVSKSARELRLSPVNL